MKSTPKNIAELLKKYRTGKASPEESALLEAWYHALDYDTTTFTDENMLRQMQAAGWEKIRKRTPVVRMVGRYWMGMTAAVFLLLAGVFYYNVQRKTVVQSYAVIQPAKDKATLTLSNGRQIILEDTDSGMIAEQNGSQVVKQPNGQLTYLKNNGDHLPNVYNTLTTPRGGQYKIVLPDGTVVWMNSASSLTYPTAFNDHERIVKLSGEAYFEVAPHAAQPFKVQVAQTTVDVLGTAFNIHAYADEPAVTTTLVTGSVRVTHTMAAGSKSEKLAPGQQAIGAATYLVTRKANMRQVLSWKNGLFIFEDSKLVDVLREISRWYDIDIDMQAVDNDTRYGGVINRNSPLPKVLELLESNGIRHFKIEGRKVIVLP